jgi:uncharacterized paraquat-inducible protein A
MASTVGIDRRCGYGLKDLGFVLYVLTSFDPIPILVAMASMATPMNTKKCPECGEEMQADARRCPKCGAVLNLQASNMWVWILAIVIFITLLYVGLSRQ